MKPDEITEAPQETSEQAPAKRMELTDIRTPEQSADYFEQVAKERDAASAAKETVDALGAFAQGRVVELHQRTQADEQMVAGILDRLGYNQTNALPEMRANLGNLVTDAEQRKKLFDRTMERLKGDLAPPTPIEKPMESAVVEQPPAEPAPVEQPAVEKVAKKEPAAKDVPKPDYAERQTAFDAMTMGELFKQKERSATLLKEAKQQLAELPADDPNRAKAEQDVEVYAALSTMVRASLDRKYNTAADMRTAGAKGGIETSKVNVAIAKSFEEKATQRGAIEAAVVEPEQEEEAEEAPPAPEPVVVKKKPAPKKSGSYVIRATPPPRETSTSAKAERLDAVEPPTPEKTAPDIPPKPKQRLADRVPLPDASAEQARLEAQKRAELLEIHDHDKSGTIGPEEGQAGRVVEAIEGDVEDIKRLKKMEEEAKSKESAPKKERETTPEKSFKDIADRIENGPMTRLLFETSESMRRASEDMRRDVRIGPNPEAFPQQIDSVQNTYAGLETLSQQRVQAVRDIMDRIDKAGEITPNIQESMRDLEGLSQSLAEGLEQASRESDEIVTRMFRGAEALRTYSPQVADTMRRNAQSIDASTRGAAREAQDVQGELETMVRALK